MFPRLDSIPAVQRRLWPELAEATHEGFVLYGGTAVALYLAHRVSVDFDFFSATPFDPDRLYRSLAFLAGSEILQSSPNTLTVLVKRPRNEEDTVKVSFFGALDFGRVGNPIRTPDGVAVVASQLDLLGNKLNVLLQRVEIMIENAFAAVKIASSEGARRTAQKKLALLLTGHAIAEEVTLYPAMASHGEKARTELAYQEQSAAKGETAALEELDPLSEDFNATSRSISSGVHWRGTRSITLKLPIWWSSSVRNGMPT